MGGGFVSRYPPPGEVAGLSFTDPQTLVWNPERSVGDYNLYRDLMSNLGGFGYGTCAEPAIREPTTINGDDPPTGDGYFYLVARVVAGVGGSFGEDSEGVERSIGAPCP